MGDNELYVVFSPDFLEDIKILGNSVIISEYYIEDIRTEITSLFDVLSEDSVYRYSEEKTDLYGIWDESKKELKTHISLTKGLYSNKVKEIIGEDPYEFEFESKNQYGINDGDGLVRLIRFKYVRPGETNSKVAFVLTGSTMQYYNGLIVNPIKCDQEKILFTINFPENTRANIKVGFIEKDTKFLEGFGIMRGINVLRSNSDSTLASRESSLEYFNYTTTETNILKKDVPFIGNDGSCKYRRDRIKVYTNVDIYCSSLIKNILPNTRGSLNKNGGTIKIYGMVKYLDYEALGAEYIYKGEGYESIDGIPDAEIIITEHQDGLNNVSINNFYINYGKYEGQKDPSVLVKARVKFYNPFKKEIEYIDSKNIRLTQEDNIVNQWEVLNRSTTFIEPTNSANVPVYLFPWKSGFTHSFTIRTTLPNLNIEKDFYMEYENPDLKNYFDFYIDRIATNSYPITDYRIRLVSKLNNTDSLNWFPIINGESEIKLSTIFLKDYGYSESFYFVQSPKSPTIELHDSNNNNITSLNLEYNQTNEVLYPVAVEASTLDDIGKRNTWIILNSSDKISFKNKTGKLNPNNSNYLTSELNIDISEESNSIEKLNVGSITVGRIIESQRYDSFNNSNWRDIVVLNEITLPITKNGMIKEILSEDSIILKEINLYKIKVTCNGPFACWINKSDDYCFFNPITNKLTNNNYYYSTNFDNSNGVYVYIALHNTTALNEEPILENEALFTVTDKEPDWNSKDVISNYFSDESNLASCKIYRKSPDIIELSYVDPKDVYIFLDSYSEEVIKYKSTETPYVDKLQTLNNSGITEQFNYRSYSYNPLTLSDSITPEFSVKENYKYHIQYIQNPNDLHDYYPVNPCCIYRAHPYNNLDISCPFYIFRKALGPSFYRAEPISINTVTMSSDLSDNTRNIIIRSRYEIHEDEFTIDLIETGSFEIDSIVSSILETSDYRYQYNIILKVLVSNNEGQRPLGTLNITSRVYDIINFTSNETVDVPYIELTQDDIDKIVQPAIMKISIIQAGNGVTTDDIKVVGNRDPNIPNSGETRSFSIVSKIPIYEPDISNEVGSGYSITGISTEGFSLRVQNITNSYTSPVVPSDTTSYISYSQPNTISFDLTINPLDSITYQPYSEKFLFKQKGIQRGLVYASSGRIPELYLGTKSVIENVNYNTTSLSIFLGSFYIGTQIINGTTGDLNGVNISTQNSYTIKNRTITYNIENWIPSVTLEFPENLSNKTVDRLFTITYNDNRVIHKLNITIKQASSFGNIICNDNAYFLSHGECIETDTYTDNLGFFTFETDLNIKDISLSIPRDLYEEYNFIYVGPGKSSSYTKYKAYIKLKPNLSNSVIKNQIFNFVKNGEIIKSVYINQGFYCLKLCYPKSMTDGVLNGGTLGSPTNPIKVPTKNNIIDGERKVFKIILIRKEPNPEEGTFNAESEITIDNEHIIFPTVQSYTWSLNNTSSNTSDRGISQEQKAGTGVVGNYLKSYQTSLFKDDPNISYNYYPFLENIYEVYSNYYSLDLIIKVSATILVNYPYNDPLYTYKKTNTYSFTMYLEKESSSNSGSSIGGDENLEET